MNAQQQTEVKTLMSSMLKSLGFDAMAEGVLTAESDLLPRYARIVLKNSPKAIGCEIRNRFYLLGLI